MQSDPLLHTERQAIADELTRGMRHDVRNRLSVIRNAAFYIKRRVSQLELWTTDARIQHFFALIDESVAHADQLLQAQTAPVVEHPGAPNSMTKILLCDDDESNRLTSSALLEDAGFELDVASSFAEASARLNDERAAYALLIFDQNLGDGLGSTLASRARVRFPAAKIVLLTGADDVDAPAVDRVVHKGQSFEALLEIVRRLLVG
ncbi:MAG TPA: response regulator [Polyangiaceae bacterium]|nr:response regulator [Polyangiaceae bacterium]